MKRVYFSAVPTYSVYAMQVMHLIRSSFGRVIHVLAVFKTLAPGDEPIKKKKINRKSWMLSRYCGAC